MKNSNMPLCEMLRPTMIHELNLKPNVQSMIKRMIESVSISNLLFYGKPGTGKTSTANIIIKSIDADSVTYNGSRFSGEKPVLNIIESFTSCVSLYQKPKICFIDEADYLSNNVQAALRYIIENVATNCRFIFTANDISKLSDAIRSRFINVNFDNMLFEREPIIEKLIDSYEQKLPMNGFKYDRDIVKKCLNMHYPDFRSVANRFEMELNRL